jgi:hypothetical protein
LCEERFEVVLTKAAGGICAARVTAIPLFFSIGHDEKEALAVIEDALRLLVENDVPLQRGVPISVSDESFIREIVIPKAATNPACRMTAGEGTELP